MKKGSGKITVVIMVLFFVAMVVLTFKAGDIHDSMLPQVVTTRAVSMSYTKEVAVPSGGTSVSKRTGKAVPEEACKDGKIFVISTDELYGRERCFARVVEIEVEAVKDGLVIFRDAGIGNKRVVVECTEELYDRMEVAVEGE